MVNPIRFILVSACSIAFLLLFSGSILAARVAGEDPFFNAIGFIFMIASIIVAREGVAIFRNKEI